MKIASHDTAYQVDWCYVELGKRMASTKRRITWKFGVQRASQIPDGATGVDCRAEEHEIVIDWSLLSGKRSVKFDGEFVLQSIQPYSSKFEETFAIGQHTIKLWCHATPPVIVPPGFRQYDMLLNGCSYFDMPRIFELGHTRDGNVDTFQHEKYSEYVQTDDGDGFTQFQPHQPPDVRTDDFIDNSIRSDVAVMDFLGTENEHDIADSLHLSAFGLRDSPPHEEQPTPQEVPSMMYQYTMEHYTESSSRSTFSVVDGSKSLPGCAATDPDFSEYDDRCVV